MKINRTQSHASTDKYNLVKMHLTHDNDVLDRGGMTAHMYPLYEKRISLNINPAGLGFSLELNEAKELVELLTQAIAEFKE